VLSAAGVTPIAPSSSSRRPDSLSKDKTAPLTSDTMYSYGAVNHTAPFTFIGIFSNISTNEKPTPKQIYLKYVTAKNKDNREALR
jgi:hypothetical protein